MEKKIFENLYFTFACFIVIIITNLIASVHFLTITFGGLLFTFFYNNIKIKDYTSLSFTIITFLLIEINIGLKPFSLSLLSLFIYVFIAPKYEYSPSNWFINIVFFYAGFFIMWIFFFEVNMRILFAIIGNLILDLLLLGALI